MKTRGKLTSERIVQVAMEMLDTGGEKDFSMRKLATELKVDPMAIYHYHRSKSALVYAVMQAMMEDFRVEDATGHWQTDIRALCYGLRRLAHRHPGTFRIYETYDAWLPAEHKIHEAFHATLLSAGFSQKAAVRAVRILLAYTEAFAVDEVSGWFDPEDRDELLKSLQRGPFPVLISLIEEFVTPDTDAYFEFGMDVLISGLEAQKS